MKPEELRIGNWVRHYSSWSYRQPNQGPMEEFDFQWDDSDWYAMGECTMEIDKIKPIALTEDWLLKFGFEKTIEHTWSFGYDKEYSVYKLDGLTYNSIQAAWWYHRLLESQPEYVHQVQNLYYALTGKELTIR